MQRIAVVLLFTGVLIFNACSSGKEPVGTTNAPATPPAQQTATETRDQDGRTELMRVVETGTADDVKQKIDSGANVNAQSFTGITPLMTAAGMGKTDTVRVLIAKGANVNAKAQGGFTALMQAALTGRADVVEILLAAGADANAEDSVTGKTAADWAEEKNHKEIVQMLEKRGGRRSQKK